MKNRYFIPVDGVPSLYRFSKYWNADMYYWRHGKDGDFIVFYGKVKGNVKIITQDWKENVESGIAAEVSEEELALMV